MSWWASRLLTPNHKTDRKNQVKRKGGQSEGCIMREEGVRMSLLRWTRWCKGITPGTVQVCPLCDLQGPLQACKPITHVISWGRIRVIPHSANGETKRQWKDSWPVHYQQEVQGKDRITASNAQRQTAWLHHSLQPGFGHWVDTVKRESMI